MDTDFKEDIKIDEFALDKEWIKQPRLFAGYCEELANADRDVGKAKEKLEVVRAELLRDIIDNPSNFGLEKTTQAMIDAVIITDGRYIEAQSYLNTLLYEKNMIQNAVRAMDMKKSALENLVKLHGQNYFSTPVSSGEHQEAVHEIKKDSAREIVKDRKRSRRRED